ncbi:NAD-dependent epimerase/dehydratase family protein [bacterium]|nr:MAG: NAD-dependent epimerase/dehydratase family protein [bacterium]
MRRVNNFLNVQKKNVVVTGGAGFVASHLADELVERGAHVTVVDSLVDGYRENVPAGAELIVADVRDTAAIDNVIASADLVFHHAAVASVPRASADPATAYDVNVSGTIAVLECIRRHNATARFLLASSASVYGTTGEPYAFSEEDRTAPASPYASSKLMAEVVALSYRRTYGIDARIVRYANIFGPRQPRYIMFDFYGKILRADDFLEILGSGMQQRDFVYVSDAVNATISVLTANLLDGCIFNVATGSATSVVDLAGCMASLMGKPGLKLVTTGKSWVGDIDYLLCAPTKLASLAWHANIDLPTGVGRYIRWMNERGLRTLASG